MDKVPIEDRIAEIGLKYKLRHEYEKTEIEVDEMEGNIFRLKVPMKRLKSRCSDLSSLVRYAKDFMVSGDLERASSMLDEIADELEMHEKE